MTRTTTRRIDPLRGRPLDARIFDRGRTEFDHVTVITTAYSVFDKRYILVDDDTAGGAVTITLPPAVDSIDEIKTIKKLGTTGNVTVDANGSETIDGATTNVLSSQYASVTVVCDGTEWWTVS